MDREEFDNLLYRYTFFCLSDLIDHVKDIQEELECLYLDLQDVSCGSTQEEQAAKARMEQRLKALQLRRRAAYLSHPDREES